MYGPQVLGGGNHGRRPGDEDRGLRMRQEGLTAWGLGLSLLAPLALLTVAAELGGVAVLVLLIGALGGLGIAAAAFGADSRDGRDWRG